MNEDRKKRWLDEAKRVFASTIVHDPDATYQSLGNETSHKTGGFTGTFRGFLRSLPVDFEEWDEATTDLLAGRFLPAKGGYETTRSATVMKAVRLGYAIAFRRHDLIQDAEASVLSSRGFDVRVLASPPVAQGAGAVFHGTFAYAYAGSRPGTSGRRPTLGHAHYSVHRIPLSETSETWRLPGPDGGELTVREYGGVPYRPVLKPGSWTPATESDFAIACTGAETWVDDPFAARWHDAPLAVREMARDLPPRGRRDGDESIKIAEESLARCGHLVSIDGVVHRRTTLPTLDVSVRGIDADESVGICWRVDKLRSTDDQSPFRNGSNSVSYYCMPDEALGTGPLLSLPATLWDVALDVRAEVARGRAATVRRDGVTSQVPRLVAEAVARPFVAHRPEAVGYVTRPDVVTEVVANLARLQGMGTGTTSRFVGAVTDLPELRGAAFRRLLRDVEKPGASGGPLRDYDVRRAVVRGLATVGDKACKGGYDLPADEVDEDIVAGMKM